MEHPMWFRLSGRWAQRHQLAIRNRVDEIVQRLLDEGASRCQQAQLNAELSILPEKEDIYGIM